MLAGWVSICERRVNVVVLLTANSYYHYLATFRVLQPCSCRIVVVVVVVVMFWWLGMCRTDPILPHLPVSTVAIKTLAVEPSAVFFIHPFHLHDRDHCRRRRHRRSDDSLRVVGGMSNLFAPDMPCIKKPTNVKVGDTRAYLHTLRAKYWIFFRFRLRNKSAEFSEF